MFFLLGKMGAAVTCPKVSWTLKIMPSILICQKRTVFVTQFQNRFGGCMRKLFARKLKEKLFLLSFHFLLSKPPQFNISRGQQKKRRRREAHFPAAAGRGNFPAFHTLFPKFPGYKVFYIYLQNVGSFNRKVTFHNISKY